MAVTPEELAQLQGLPGLASRSKLVADLLRRAQEERVQPAFEARTPVGAALGGIGDVLRQRKLNERRGELEKRLGGLERQESAALGTAFGAAGRLPSVDESQLFAPDEAVRGQAMAGLVPAAEQREVLGRQALATGDPRLAKFGESLLEEAKRLRGLAVSAPEEVTKRALSKEQLSKAATERELETSPASETLRGLAQRFGVTLPEGVTTKQALTELALAERAFSAEQRTREAELNRAAQRGVREEATAAREERERERQIELLSKRLEAAPALRQDLAKLLELSKESDIPGFGATGRVPSFLLTSRGKEARQSARGLVGSIIKARSGVAASEGEVARIMEETGLGPDATDEQVRLGLRRLTEQAQDALRQVEVAATPEALEEARRRGLITSKDIEALRAKPEEGLDAKARRLEELRRKAAQ